jgi:hypothetical protein
MLDWSTPCVELAPPVFDWLTVVVELLLELAAPVVMDAELLPVLAELEVCVAEPPVLPVAAPLASPLPVSMFPPFAEPFVLWSVLLLPQTPDEAVFPPLFAEPLCVVDTSLPCVTLREASELLSSPPPPPCTSASLWLTVWFESAPPLFIWPTDVAAVFVAVAGPVEIVAALVPSFVEPEVWSDVPPALPAVAPFASPPSAEMLPSHAETSPVWLVVLSPHTPESDELFPVSAVASCAVVALDVWSTQASAELLLLSELESATAVPANSPNGRPAANRIAPTLPKFFLLANEPPLIAWPASCPLASR